MAAMSADAITVGIAAVAAAIFVVGVVLQIRRARSVRAALRVDGALVEGEVLRILQEPNGAYLVRYQFTPEGARAPVTRARTEVFRPISGCAIRACGSPASACSRSIRS